jgi:copper chaperone
MRVKKAIEGLQGVQDLDVRIGSADVTFDESKVREKDIEDVVTKAGYKVRS